ncbi:MAG: hypothetical protein KDA45_06220 [Planctomycetales bacterium]|nr:hypothetical protein [Planctomycetales bacterium]
MTEKPATVSPLLSLDGLRRMQLTLTRRAVNRDPRNIHAVGFAPAGGRPQERSQPGEATQDSCLPLTAQFDVVSKQREVVAQRIAPRETVRLLDRRRQHYLRLELPTTVRLSGPIIPTGVRVDADSGRATTSVIVRWTTTRPVPSILLADPEDPRWRWGLLTVAHLFAGKVGTSAARVQRQAACGDGPRDIAGRLVARGRIPGGPDIGLLETGLERLWLSGFLPRLELPSLALAGEPELVRWISSGTHGKMFASGAQLPWRWNAYYPQLSIAGLGRLSEIICYEFSPASSELAARSNAPFGPGNSGGVLVAGGIPIGLQVAAMRPEFRVGYAQAFHTSLAWLKKRLRASAIDIANVL